VSDRVLANDRIHFGQVKLVDGSVALVDDGRMGTSSGSAPKHELARDRHCLTEQGGNGDFVVKRILLQFRVLERSRSEDGIGNPRRREPLPRAVEPPEHGRVVALPHVSGLHYRYVRRAA